MLWNSGEKGTGAGVTPRILDAASDILSQEGLAALSIRAIAERIEYSPATIHLYFRYKEDLVRAVVAQGVRLLKRYLREELASVAADGNGRAKLGALADGYVRLALENTAYFRVMFELPGVPRLGGAAPTGSGVALAEEQPFRLGVAVVEQAIGEGEYDPPGGAEEAALVGCSVVHGLVTLYLTGHLRGVAADRDGLQRRVDAALDSVFEGWPTREPSGEGKLPSS